MRGRSQDATGTATAATDVVEHVQRWQYRAAALDGSYTHGHVLAGNQEEARSAIRRLKQMPLEVQADGAQRVHKAPLPVDQLALGLRILADLFDAGLPINRVLATFDGLAPPAWRPALPTLHGAIREGRSFAHALDSAPVAIPALVSGVIAAGEAGSGIGPAIRRAGDIMESAAATQAAVRAALTYPLILASAGTASIALLIGVVLPRFAQILADLGQELPTSTRMLIQVSLLAQRSFVPAAIVAGALLAAWYFWVQSDSGLRAWHRFLLTLPGIATFRLATASSRASIALSTLLTSGVSLPAALSHAARATGDAEIGARITSVRAALTRGDSLAHAVEQSAAMTMTTIRLIGAGEQAGRLPEMLLHAGKIEQELADRMLRASVRMLEPILVLTFALVVGLVAAALLQAVYSVRPTA